MLPSDAKSVGWYSLQSTVDSYSLSDQEFGFAGGAPRWIYREPVFLSAESICKDKTCCARFMGDRLWRSRVVCTG